MTKVLNTIEEVVVDTLHDEMKKLDNTSKMIRYLISQAPDQNKCVAFAYNKLKQYGITTKDGGEIRYQHVRNVHMTKLSSK